MEGSSVSVETMNAARNDPALQNVDIDAIKTAAMEGAENPEPNNPSAAKLYKDAQDEEAQKKSDCEKALPGLDLSGDRPFDPNGADGKPNPAAVKNLGYLRGLLKKLWNFCGLGENEDPSTPEAKAKLAKAKVKLEEQAKSSTSAKAQVALGILSLLTTLADMFYNIWKYDQVQDQLAKLAAAFNSCNEVNYTSHTNKRLSCNNNDSTLKSKCRCDPGTTAPDLKSLCTDFDPTHTCGTYSYVYMQYSIYDVVAALIHGAEDAPSWVWAHKWYILGAVAVIIIMLIAFGMAKRYAAS
jgi:hypothetical protein